MAGFSLWPSAWNDRTAIAAPPNAAPRRTTFGRTGRNVGPTGSGGEGEAKFSRLLPYGISGRKIAEANLLGFRFNCLIFQLLEFPGAPERIRTSDPQIRSLRFQPYRKRQEVVSGAKPH
jgi:hypothetical protein